MSTAQLKKFAECQPGDSQVIRFNHKQLLKNYNHHRGFLSNLLHPVVGGVMKEIAESSWNIDPNPSVVWRKSSASFHVTPDENGQGLHLSPWAYKLPRGYGLFLAPFPQRQEARPIEIPIYRDIYLKGWTDQQRKNLYALT